MQALILAGGGAKGAYQAGALAALHGFLADRGALGNVRMLAGTSVGAWNACFWLAGMVSEEPDSPLERWWSELRLSEVVAPTFYFPAARNFVLSADPWRQAGPDLARCAVMRFLTRWRYAESGRRDLRLDFLIRSEVELLATFDVDAVHANFDISRSIADMERVYDESLARTAT